MLKLTISSLLVNWSSYFTLVCHLSPPRRELWRGYLIWNIPSDATLQWKPRMLIQRAFDSTAVHGTAILAPQIELARVMTLLHLCNLKK